MFDSVLDCKSLSPFVCLILQNVSLKITISYSVFRHASLHWTEYNVYLNETWIKRRNETATVLLDINQKLSKEQSRTLLISM